MGYKGEMFSTRFAFDLQACQTYGAYQRGIGNYSMGLFDAISKVLPASECFSIGSKILPHDLPTAVTKRKQHIELSTELDWRDHPAYLGGDVETLGAIEYAAQIQAIKPDVIHSSHSFVGLGDHILGPSFVSAVPGQIQSATLYDLIPLIYKDHYLSDERTARSYHYQLENLRRFDLLLAISETTKRDAIDHLGIDPARIVNIYGGIAPIFDAPIDSVNANKRSRGRFGLREKFILYTGGDDHRKNIEGLIKAYARLDAIVRETTSLVIVAKMSEVSLRNHTELLCKLGLNAESVIFTGYVDDDVLVDLYQSCDCFIFPSFYEGLGLPVIEAMRCGAPVIGADTSSIREIIDMPEARFNPGVPDDIARIATRVLTDDDFNAALRNYGRNRSLAFSWRSSALTALEAFDEALARKRERELQIAVENLLPRKRLALFSPVPPTKSGISDYTADFVPFLNRHFDIDLYIFEAACTDQKLCASTRIYNHEDFAAAAKLYDVIVYEVGNSAYHAHMLELMQRHPGVVVLHDGYLSNLLEYLGNTKSNTWDFHRELLYSHGNAGRKRVFDFTASADQKLHPATTLPVTKRVIDSAIGMISHTPFNLELAKLHYPEGWRAPYRIIPQVVANDKLMLRNTVDESQKQLLKNKLGFKASTFVISTFGHIADTKRPDLILEAITNSDLLSKADIALVFVGKLAEDPIANKLASEIKRTKLANVKITGFVDQSRYNEYLCISDLAIQLRESSRGGTPKSVPDCLALGVPTIINDTTSFKDYPSDVVFKIPDNLEVQTVRNAIECLFLDHEKRNQIAENGYHFIRSENNGTLCAAKFAMAIHEFTAKHRLAQVTSYSDALTQVLGSLREFVEIDIHQPAITNSFTKTKVVVVIEPSDNTPSNNKALLELIRLLLHNDQSSADVTLAFQHGNSLIHATSWLQNSGLVLETEYTHQINPQLVLEDYDRLVVIATSPNKLDHCVQSLALDSPTPRILKTLLLAGDAVHIELSDYVHLIDEETQIITANTNKLASDSYNATANLLISRVVEQTPTRMIKFDRTQSGLTPSRAKLKQDTQLEFERLPTNTSTTRTASTTFGPRLVPTANSSFDQHLMRHIGAEEYVLQLVQPFSCAPQLPANASAAEELLGRWHTDRILIDVSHIAQTDLKSGIQRIVRDVVLALYRDDIEHLEVVAVQIANGQIMEASTWLTRLGLEPNLNGIDGPIQISPNDYLLMLDSSWNTYQDNFLIFDTCRRVGAKIVSVVYDLLPLQIPHCFEQATINIFQRWIHNAIDQSDALVSISKATNDRLQSLIRTKNTATLPALGFWHHGCTFDDSLAESVDTQLPDALQQQDFLLMVGTIEPRKMHQQALEALERCWERGSKLKLCLAGKMGWNMEKFTEVLSTHNQLNANLIHIDSPSDAVLQKLYQSAAGLLFLSEGEGYGLPLIEAAHFGLPVLCSDIDSFREIAGENVCYTEADSPKELADDILSWYEKVVQGTAPDISRIQIRSVTESSRALVDLIRRGLEY